MSVDVPSASCTVSSPFRRCRDRISLTRSGALTGHTPNASPGWYRMPESDRSISMCSTSFSALREVIFWRTDRLAVKGCSRVQTCAAGASAVAAAAGLQYGISLEQAADGLKNLKLTDKRLTVRSADGIKVIDDTYNASPDSMRGAIDVLCSTDGMRRVAVLGDMFELGEDSAEFHRHVGEYVGKRGVDLHAALAIG